MAPRKRSKLRITPRLTPERALLVTLRTRPRKVSTLPSITRKRRARKLLMGSSASYKATTEPQKKKERNSNEIHGAHSTLSGNHLCSCFRQGRKRRLPSRKNRPT